MGHSSFTIAAKQPDAPDVGDVRHIRISAGNDVLTRLVRNGREDDGLDAPPTPLAFWLVDNWWRLLFEPVPVTAPDPSWRLAHELSSIGGYIWPRMALWGEGERVGIAVRQEPLPTPLQFLARGVRYVSLVDVESGIDRFIEQVLDEEVDDRKALGTEYHALRAERDDPDSREWRVVEAMLGYDVDEAPHELVESLGEFIDRYGEASIEEAVLAQPGEEAVDALQQGVAAASASRACARLPIPIESIAFHRDPNRAPWEMAEEAAASLRNQLSLTGPIRNQHLCDVFGVSRSALKSHPGRKPPYGLRIREENGEGSHIGFHTVRSRTRRFELCRNVADVIWSGNDALGPVSDAMSGRQKFQRAFAQSFLCPYEELLEYCGQRPTLHDVPAAAEHFHVSERTIDTILLNKGHIERDAFMEMVGSS